MMIGMAIASAITMIAMQASINAPRSAFSACLKEVLPKAQAEKVAPAAFGAYAKSACAGKSESLRSALVSFDVKNGIGRSRALADAEVQIDEYYTMSAEQYQYRYGKTQAD